MKRVLVALFLVMLGSPAWANTCPSYTYTLTNGTTADASQVMSNFNTIMNCASYFIGGTSGGTATAQTLTTVSPAVFSLSNGNRVTFLAGFSTTGATTLNVSSTGAVNILKKTSSGLVALGAGDVVSGQVYTVQYDGTQYELLDPIVTGAGGGPKGAFKNLHVYGACSALTSGSCTTQSNTAVIVTVDEEVAENSTGAYVTGRSLSLTIGTGGTGANGLDTGTLAASTWYSAWAIYNPTTATWAGLLSLSTTSPTLPSGYSYSARVGWVRTDASKNLYRTLQSGRRAQYVITASTNTAALPTLVSGATGSVSTPTYTQFSLAALVPTTASLAAVVATWSSTSTSTAIYAPNGAYGASGSITNPPMASITGGAAEKFDVVLETQNIYAAQQANVASFIAGWEDNL
jgi:hypothetical protein